MRFIHTADHHIGKKYKRFEHISNKLALENMRVLEELATLAITTSDLWLIAGDLYEYNQISTDEKRYIANLFADVARTTPILVVAGNHDPFYPGSFHEELSHLPGVHVFRHSRPQRIDFPALNTSIYGRSFQALYERESFLPNILCDADEQLETAPLANRLLLLHGDVKIGQATSEFNLLDGRALSDLPVAYIALGHVHHADLASNLKWRYAGAPTGHSFKRTGETGYYRGEIEGGRLLALDFCTLDTIHFYSLPIELAIEDTKYDVINKLKAAVKAKGSQHVYRFILQGEVPRFLNQDLAEIYEGITSYCLAAEVLDQTRPFHDLYRLAQDESLRGYFYRQILDASKQDDVDPELMKLVLNIGLEAIDDQV